MTNPIYPDRNSPVADRPAEQAKPIGDEDNAPPVTAPGKPREEGGLQSI